MSRAAFISAILGVLIAGPLHAGNSQDSEADRIRQELRALHWISGPTTVTIADNSKLALPAGYVYLNPEETAKFATITQTISDHRWVMIAPKNLQWDAFLEFDDTGYVRDSEKVDASAVINSLIAGTDEENAERVRRGWAPVHIVGWSMQPTYNAITKRLEWAVVSRSSYNGESTNFFTDVLGRRGCTSVVLVADPKGAMAAISSLDRILTGYRFNVGERYVDYRPGDKVAGYGLAGLILGGAAAAVKTTILGGLLRLIIAGAAAVWKFLAAAAAAIIAFPLAGFKRKRANQNVPSSRRFTLRMNFSPFGAAVIYSVALLAPGIAIIPLLGKHAPTTTTWVLLEAPICAALFWTGARIAGRPHTVVSLVLAVLGTWSFILATNGLTKQFYPGHDYIDHAVSVVQLAFVFIVAWRYAPQRVNSGGRQRQ